MIAPSPTLSLKGEGALTLVIGNMNYSSWSMRPWVLMRQLGIPFEQVKLHFHSSEWDAQIARWSPSRLVPVLWRGEPSVRDSLAIMETLHEWYPDKGVWPRDRRATRACPGTTRSPFP